MKNTVVLENIRSAYNVGNIIRTADALDFDVILLGYTPSPFENEKVLKTSLGAEKNVNIQQFYNVKKGLDFLKENFPLIIGAELTEDAIPIYELKNHLKFPSCIIMGNEVNGISIETLEKIDIVSFIPMK
jgi:tRNA G18 (ribose-2'-O)-methylase SpoU